MKLSALFSAQVVTKYCNVDLRTFGEIGRFVELETTTLNSSLERLHSASAYRVSKEHAGTT
jgi:hypothetical protein